MTPLDEVLAAIETHQSFIIAGHVGPDGDAIGSGLALRMGLESLGKEASLVSSDGVPSTCRFLPGWQSVTSGLTRQPQCALVIDCNGLPNRVAAPYHLIENARYKVMIDHHRTSRPIFDVNWIDAAQPATALMIYQVLKRLPIAITAAMAQCLMCGLSTDTGNFRFPNTTPECLLAASELVSLGAEPAVIAFKLFDERSFESTKLLGIALQKMQSDCDGQLMWVALGTDDFEAAKTGDEGSENIVNILRSVRGARMAIILRERCDETGPVARISVRCDLELRADLFCEQFGGGGHAAASGCRIRYRPFAESAQIVVQAACAWLREKHPPLEFEEGKG